MRRSAFHRDTSYRRVFRSRVVENIAGKVLYLPSTHTRTKKKCRLVLHFFLGFFANIKFLSEMVEP